jgi:hypothetical protein
LSVFNLQLDRAKELLRDKIWTILDGREMRLVSAATNKNIAIQQDVIQERERTRRGVMGGRYIDLRSSVKVPMQVMEKHMRWGFQHVKALSWKDRLDTQKKSAGKNSKNSGFFLQAEQIPRTTPIADGSAKWRGQSGHI